jgi:ubiquinone/menaquinone biosynthesis C-methylase UbiE
MKLDVGALTENKDRPHSEPDYIWGRGTTELERLIEQGRFLGVLTEQFMRQAGIGPGMRVLDVGCGAGDVSFLAARLVGPEGAVIGLDISSEAIRLATERAGQAHVGNVEFICEDAANLLLERPVDAVVGRLVLIFFPEPAAVLRRLLRNVRSDGIVAFQELHVTIDSEPHCALFTPRSSACQKLSSGLVTTCVSVSSWRPCLATRV